MRIDLSGFSALVTGSTAGIGLATAKRLAGTGARVIVNGRTPARGGPGVDASATTGPAMRIDGGVVRAAT